MNKLFLILIFSISTSSFAKRYHCDELADLELGAAMSLGDFFIKNYSQLEEEGVYMALKDVHAKLLVSASHNSSNFSMDNDRRGGCRTNVVAVKAGLHILEVFQTANNRAKRAYQDLLKVLKFTRNDKGSEGASF